MQTYLEQWLRLMLRWDPKARGGGLAKDKRPACFTMLDNILAMKVSGFVFTVICYCFSCLLFMALSDYSVLANVCQRLKN